MKKIITIFILALLIFSCRKKTIQTDQEIIENYQEETINKAVIDFEKMETLIKKSEEMDIEVFFAISVLHKYYISKYELQAESLNEKDKNLFFENKKKDFFKKIKYTENEYDKFMESNRDKLNSYINQHPEIIEYLTTFN